MFNVRIIKIDYYMSVPIKNLDFSYSQFRGNEINQVPVLRVFGSTPSGHKTCLHVHKVFPYLYIPHNEQNEVSTSQLAYRLANNLDKAINISLGQTNSNMQHVFNVLPVIGIPIYGYHENKHTFLKIQFYNPIMVKKSAILLQNGAVLNTIYQPHEAHINYELQFMIDYNLHGMKEITLQEVQFRVNNNQQLLNNIPKNQILPTSIRSMSTCKLEVDCSADDIINIREVFGQNLSANPGILALWNEERERRHKQNRNYPLTPLPSQTRKKTQTDSELFFFNRLKDNLYKNVNENLVLTSSELSNESVYPGEAKENSNILDASLSLLSVNFASNSTTQNLSEISNVKSPLQISNVNLDSSSNNFSLNKSQMEQHLVNTNEKDINEKLILDLTLTELISQTNENTQELESKKIDFIDDDSILSQKPKNNIEVNEYERNDNFFNENVDDILVLDDDDTEYTRYFSETLINCDTNISQIINSETKSTTPDSLFHCLTSSKEEIMKEVKLNGNESNVNIISENHSSFHNTTNSDENNHRLSQNIIKLSVEEQEHLYKHKIDCSNLSSTINNINWDESIFDDVDIKQQNDNKTSYLEHVNLIKNSATKKKNTNKKSKSNIKIISATCSSDSDESDCSDIFNIINDKIPQLDGLFDEIDEKKKNYTEVITFINTDGQSDEPSKIKNKHFKSKLRTNVFFQQKMPNNIPELATLSSFLYKNKTSTSDDESKTSANTFNTNDIEINLNWKRLSSKKSLQKNITNKAKIQQNENIKNCTVKLVDIMKVKNNLSVTKNNVKKNHLQNKLRTDTSIKSIVNAKKSKDNTEIKFFAHQKTMKSIKTNSSNTSRKLRSHRKSPTFVDTENIACNKIENIFKEPTELKQCKSQQNVYKKIKGKCKTNILKEQNNPPKKVDWGSKFSNFDEYKTMSKKYLSKIKKTNDLPIKVKKKNTNKSQSKEFMNKEENKNTEGNTLNCVKQNFETASQYDIRNNFFPQPGCSKDISEPLNTSTTIMLNSETSKNNTNQLVHYSNSFYEDNKYVDDRNSEIKRDFFKSETEFIISDNSTSSSNSQFENDCSIKSFYNTFIEAELFSDNEPNSLTYTSNQNDANSKDCVGNSKTACNKNLTEIKDDTVCNNINLRNSKKCNSHDFNVQKDCSFQSKQAFIENKENGKKENIDFEYRVNENFEMNESKQLSSYKTDFDIEYTQCIGDNQLSSKALYRNKLELTQPLSLFTDITNSKKPKQNFSGYVILCPKYNPPSPTYIKSTLMNYEIPNIKQLSPFYSNSTDVTCGIEIGRKIVKISSLNGKDIYSFKTSVISNSIENLRKQFIENDASLNKISNYELIKCLTSKRTVIITPSIFPPKTEDVKFWIQTKQFKVLENKIEKRNEKLKIIVPSSPNNETGEDSSDEYVTLSPYTPKENSIHTVNLSEHNLLFKDKDYYNKNITISSELPNENLQTNQFLEQIVSPQKHNSSCIITGPSLSSSKAFQLPLENLQNAKAVIEHQFLTVCVLEIHIRTRENLKPDPNIDPIQAIFYSIYNDVPENYELPRKETGIICIDDSGKNNLLNDIYLNNNLNIIYVQSEADIMNKLIDLFTKWDPDILIGYEIEMLSWGYLFERAFILNVNLISSLSRIPTIKMNKKTIENPKLLEVNLSGRILLDMWRLMRHEVALYSYTLENVVYHVLHERIPKYSFKDLTSWFENEKKVYRWITIEYYIKRVEIILNILERLDLIGRTCELARLFGIQFYEVLSRGSQFRVESMMLRLAKPLNYISVSPSVQQRSKMKAPEFLPLIMEPESRFYEDPVIVLDFQSLYPSMIIAYNYCFSTCLGRVDLLGQPSPFPFGATQLKIKQCTLNKLIKKNQLNISPCGVAFVTDKVRQGILPRMLKEILDARLMVKQSMKENKDNPTLHRILHSRQLGLKLIANVTYGYTAANFSGRMPCIEIGDSVVSKGKETLERAIKLVENNEEWKAKVVYGDTDSLFVLIPGRTRQDAFKIGNEIADAVTKDNPTPVKLKLEKVYQPCILQTKKRYVGYMYENADQEIPEYNAKGIETIRRDGCPAVAKILEKTLRLLFETKDMSLVKQYVCKQFTKLLTGRINLQDLIFAREFRGMSGYKPGAFVSALELARRYKMQDPRNEPRRSERVPYIIVNGSPGMTLTQLSRGPQELLADSSLRPHIMYYITRVIIPALNRCLLLCGVDVHSWFRDVPRKSNCRLPVISSKNSKKITLSQHFTIANCICCGSQTKDHICVECQKNLQKTSVIINSKIHYWERNYFNTKKICRICCNGFHENACISLDCPILYRLHQTKKDFEQTSFLRNILINLSYEECLF